MNEEEFGTLYRNPNFHRRVKYLCGVYFRENRGYLYSESIFDAEDLESLAWQVIAQVKKAGQVGNYYLNVVKWRFNTLLRKGRRKSVNGPQILGETIPSAIGYNADGEREEEVSLFDKYAEMEYQRLLSIEQEHKGIFDCEIELADALVFQMIRFFQPGTLFIDFETWECYLCGRPWRAARQLSRYRAANILERISV